MLDFRFAQSSQLEPAAYVDAALYDKPMGVVVQDQEAVVLNPQGALLSGRFSKSGGVMKSTSRRAKGASVLY